MNRLSSYAQNESNTESPEDKQKSEEEAVTALLEKLRVSKETEAAKAQEAKEAKAKAEQPNGEQTSDESSGLKTPEESETSQKEEKPPSVNGAEDAEPELHKKSRGIPPNVKLFEIFYGQVTHLVQAQRLPIQDTTALLVSLANLAL